MRQGLCNGTVSVCPSVCPFHLSTAATACGGFAAVGPAGRRYRSIPARPAPSSNGAAAAHRIATRRSAANASSVTFTAAVEAVHRLVLSAVYRSCIFGVTAFLRSRISASPFELLSYTAIHKNNPSNHSSQHNDACM